MEYYLAFKKEEHPATFDNMDEPRKLDTLWNKLDTKVPGLHDSSSMKYVSSQLLRSREHNNGFQNWGNRDLVFSQWKFSIRLNQ
jgi:hypothetical protein